MVCCHFPHSKNFRMDGWSIPSHATLRRNAVAAQEKCGPTASVLLEAICVVTASLNTLKRPTLTLKATSRFTVDCNFFCDCLCSQIECHMCIFSVETYIPLERAVDEIYKDLCQLLLMRWVFVTYIHWKRR